MAYPSGCHCGSGRHFSILYHLVKRGLHEFHLVCVDVCGIFFFCRLGVSCISVKKEENYFLLQGYFRAWHIEQKTYKLHAVNHYLIVGVTMIGLSFVQIVSPVIFIMAFGALLCGCGVWDFSSKKNINVNKKEAENRP